MYTVEGRGSENFAKIDPSHQIVAHYVYPCQRFSSGNTLEDYNPQSKCQQSFPLILITTKGVNLSSCVLAKPKQLLSIIVCLFKR
jgi:hypothetical protein